MKIVIVSESGFLKDICLDQSVDSKYIYDWADNGLITLAVPEYAFVESDGGLQQQYRKQRARLQETANLANELGRSQNLQSLATQLKQLVAELQSRIDAGATLVKVVLDEIRSNCLMIPTNFEIFHRARLRTLSATPPPDEIDCQIFESVLSFLREHQQGDALRLFLTHDRNHFDYPEIHQEIEAVGAIIVFSSSECLRVIREHLP
ncbi:hypothetical protein IH992_32215 [Candidatus Poribacteria bacterium]|nr:hypothetical protein [Candidatus Poribacteria bacterium]